MYAIIEADGRQLKVHEGDELEVDFRDLAAGETIAFDRVLALSGNDGLKLGSPLLEGVSVSAEVLGPARGPKLVVQTFRNRKNSHHRTGHRQLHTRVRITKIGG